MADWDDSIETSNNGYHDTEADSNRGRSFGKGRGFVPNRSEDNSFGSGGSGFGGGGGGFGGRGRGGRGGRGSRGGFGGNDGDRNGGGGWGSSNNEEGGGWGNSNNDGGFRGGERRGRGCGGRGRGGRRGSDDDNDGFGGGGGGGGGWGSNRRDEDSDDRRGRGGRGGGRGRGGRRGSDDEGGGGGAAWGSGNDNKDEGGFGGDGEEPEKKPEPVTYVPEDRTEEDLFKETGIQKGINFDDYENIEVKVSGENKPSPINSFQEAQLRDLILSNLKRCRYDKPTPIQKYAIPIITAGRDLMATAQTGSGKTAAFLLPIIHRLLSDQVDSSADGQSCSPQAIILSPTRELAIQIEANARLYTSQSTLRVEILYGGVSTRHQSNRIFRGCNIMIATPGRLKDFVNRGYVKFNRIQFVVLDEADRMLDMGFSQDIVAVMSHETMSPQNQRQTLMFSATFSQEIQKLAGKYLRPDYLFVTVGIVGGACKDVEQNFLSISRDEKKKKLLSLLEEQASLKGTLLFVEQKRVADFLASFLSDKGFSTTSIHGDRQQYQREEALKDFKSGRMSVLVATNVAARGLDINGVTHVINYDLPKEIDEYVHRIGRTGRLGNKGKATSFYDSSQDRELANNLVRILKQANQRVPDFIEQDATGGGDYESSGFGGSDYRNDGFVTDSRNQPQNVQGEEDW